MENTVESLFRPVRASDGDALTELVGSIADGLTTLPNDPHYLKHRIERSEMAFDHRVKKPGGEAYLFVLENVRDGRLIGTSGLVSRVGGFDPFYTYTRKRELTTYPKLGIEVELETLHLTRNHKGPTEISSLFLHPEKRSGGLGRLLSLARFAFIKAFPDRFAQRIIAELRGYIDTQGTSPFWEAVGQKFFQKDYYTADILSGVGEKDFIEALMPAHPIYITLLPASARSVIGKVHPDTEAALRLLLAEGFSQTDEVDIFDAGPLLSAHREELKSWQALSTRIAKVGTGTTGPSSKKVIVANGSLDFRAALLLLDTEDADTVELSRETLELLQLEAGDPVQVLPLA
jgi:arginine N-succinyltransferase